MFRYLSYVLVSLPTVAQAASPPAIIPKRPDGAFPNLATVINKLFNFGIVAGAIIFVILFLFGGISYLFGAGNNDTTEKAKKLMLDALIGLVLTLAAWAIGNFVLGQLGVTITIP